jgi:hypothetical protein
MNPLNLDDSQLAALTALNIDWLTRAGKMPQGMRVRVILEAEPHSSLEVIVTDGTDRDAQAARTLDRLLSIPSQKLELEMYQARYSRIMEYADILTLGELVRKTANELLKFAGFGRKTLREVESALKKLGFTLGMSAPIGPLERQVILSRPVSGLYYVPRLFLGALHARGFASMFDIIDLGKRESLLDFLGGLAPSGSSNEDAQYDRWLETYPTAHLRLSETFRAVSRYGVSCT